MINFLGANFERQKKLVRKFSKIIFYGLRPSAVYGRFTGPKILINSIPKSGTNLLQELVHCFPSVHGKVQKVLSSSMREENVVEAILNIKIGQCTPAHVFYSEAVASAIVSNNVKLILVVRDFRDSLMSHIRYLESIDLTHPHQEFYKQFKTLDQKLNAYLGGTKDFPSWQAMVSQYRGWHSFPNVFIVRFEDLISEDGPSINAKKVVRDLSEYLALSGIDAEYLISKMVNKNGLTYNSPSVGKWKTNLTADQIEKVNLHMADELRFWGYSND